MARYSPGGVYQAKDFQLAIRIGLLSRMVMPNNVKKRGSYLSCSLLSTGSLVR